MNRRMDRPRWPAAIFGLFVFAILSARLVVVDPGYSLDYDVYVHLIGNISTIGYKDIFRDAIANFPYFYVDVGSRLQFEFGSVLIFKILMSVFKSEHVVFALVGGFSSALKAYAFVRLRVEPVAVVLLLLVSAVLLESNAIRLALGVSFLLLAILSVRDGNWLFGMLWFAAAYLAHVQAIIFFAPFAGMYAATRPGVGRWLRFLSLGGGVLGAIVFSYLLSRVGTSKLDDYDGAASGAVGINLVSVLGAGALVLAIWRWMGAGRPSLMAFSGGHRLWGAVIGSTVFALVLLLTLTSYGAVGDRVWQAAFLIFVPVSYWYIRQSGWAGRDAILMKGLLYTMLLSYLFLTVVRYPLSNLLHPLITWSDLRFS